MVDDVEKSERAKQALLRLAEALVIMQAAAYEELGEIETSVAVIAEELRKSESIAREVMRLLGDDHPEVTAVLAQSVDPADPDDDDADEDEAPDTGDSPAREVYLEGSLDEVLAWLRRMRFRRAERDRED
jgi:hypothetical protein